MGCENEKVKMGWKLPPQVDNLFHTRSPRRYRALAFLVLIALLITFTVSPDRVRIARVPETWHESSPLPASANMPPAQIVPLLRDSRRPGQVVASPDRVNDVSDTFEPYTRYPGCNTTATELHDAFYPLCSEKDSLLTAMTGGGRSGIDMPFIPRECDMRWFSHIELCDILSRFSNISVVGDSMMRNLALAMHQLIRRDLRNGPAQNWNNYEECKCHNAFENPECWAKGAWGTQMILENDPESMWCPYPGTAPIEFNVLLTWPLENDAEGFTKTLPKEKPEKPHAFLYGHGLWNNVNETASTLWLEQVQENVNKTMPWLMEPDAVYPRLFISPSCSGGGKPEKFLKTQGNPSLGRFELAMGPAAKERGVDHLGVFNLTMQNTTPDGTHAGMHANLVKAMMVFNWLNNIDVSGY